MNHSSVIANRFQIKFSHFIILLFLICYETILPIKGWAQLFSDTGSFTFTGSHNPVAVRQQFAQFLPGDGVKVGPAKIHTFLGVAEVFTDNVFRRSTQRRNDFLTTVAPGIQALLPFGGRHSMLLDYRAAQFTYAKFSENNALAQNGVGHLTLDFPGGLNINFEGDHIEGFDPRGSELDTQQRDITKWRSNTVRTTAEFARNNFGIRGGVRYTQLHFRNNGQDAPRDRKDYAANLTVFIPANLTTSALLGAFVSKQNFDTNNQLDSFSYGIFTGFRLAPTRQLSGELNIGYNILNFDHAPESDPAKIMDLQQKGLSLGGKQQKAIFMSGDLIWRPTSRLDFILRPFQFIQQSAVFNTSTFTQTGVLVRARQRFDERFAISGRFLYSNDDFEGSRNDKRYRWRAALDYRAVKWLGFQLAYIFEKRSSNQNDFDFYGNTIMISVQGFL